MKNILTAMQAAADAGVAVMPVVPADKSMPAGTNTDAVLTFTAQVAAPAPILG